MKSILVTHDDRRVPIDVDPATSVIVIQDGDRARTFNYVSIGPVTEPRFYESQIQTIRSHNTMLLLDGKPLPIKKPVAVKMLGSRFPECQDEACAFKRECANHVTAGDFRVEDGLSPDLSKCERDWECSQDGGNFHNHGAIDINGVLMDRR